MDIKRFYVCVPSVQVGGERIKELIADIKKAKKDMKYSYSTNVKIDLNGCIYTRSIRLDRIDNIRVANDELKISFIARIRKGNNTYECVDKDATIGIPIRMIDSIEVDVIA